MSGKLKNPKQIGVCKPGSGRTIFDGPGQHVSVDPSTIKLLSDRVLILDIPQDDETRNGLVIPDIAKQDGVGKDGLFRVGLVIAVGEGDRYIEHSLDAQGQVRRTLITIPCKHDESDRWFDVRNYLMAERPCPFCDNGGDGRIPVTVPAQCKPGDTVIYDRRREAEMIINGQRYAMLHAEQSVLAIRNDDGSLKWLYSRVAVQPMDIPASSLIVKPSTAKNDGMRLGNVVGVGPGSKIVDGKVLPLPVKVGYTVMFGEYAGGGQLDSYGGVLVLNGGDLVAVLENL